MIFRECICFFGSLLVLAGFGLVPRVGAQQATPGETRVFPVGVYDKEGRLIPSLSAAQLHVRVGKERIPVRQVSLADAPRRIVLLLDVSGTMALHWQMALQLARALVSVAQAGDVFMLGCFGDELRSLQPLTDNQLEILAALARLEKDLEKEEPNGPTALFDALGAGVEALARNPQFGDAVVVITDGWDNFSRIAPPEVRDKALRAGVRLFAPLADWRLSPMIVLAPSRSVPAATRDWEMTGEMGGRERWPATKWGERGAVTRFRELVSDIGGASLEFPDLRFLPRGGNMQPKPLLELATKLYWRVRTVYRVELELAKPIQKPTKIKIEARDEQGRKLKDVELSYPRYLLPLPARSGSPQH